MQEQIKEYRTLLTKLVSLQQRLIQALETEIDVLPLPPDFPRGVRGRLENVILPGHSISRVLRNWPLDIGIVPIFAWVRPRKGVVKVEGQDWLFDLHGSTQVSFIGLPFGLNEDMVEDFETGKTDVHIGLSVGESGICVEVEYLRGGRSDGVSAWSTLQFAQSVRSKMGGLSQSDHRYLLEELVREGFICPWPGLSIEQDRHFVLAGGDDST